MSVPKTTGAASSGAALSIRRESRSCTCNGTGVIYPTTNGEVHPEVCPCRYLTADQTDAAFGSRGVVMSYGVRDVDAEPDAEPNPRPSLWHRLTGRGR